MLLESRVKATVELQGFRVMAVTGDAGGLVAELVPDLRFSPRCGQCGAPGQYRDTRRTRRFRHVPLWGIAVALRYAPRRVRCARCAGVHVESLPWVSGKQQMTRALMVVLATWARTLPWQQVARLFRCSWGTVATAVEEAVAYQPVVKVPRSRDRHDRSCVLHCRAWRWGQAAVERGKRRCGCPRRICRRVLGTRFTSG